MLLDDLIFFPNLFLEIVIDVYPSLLILSSAVSCPAHQSNSLFLISVSSTVFSLIFN